MQLVLEPRVTTFSTQTHLKLALQKKRLEEVLNKLNGSGSFCHNSLTYLGSFLEQGDHHRRVSAAHRPVERTHPAVVYVLYHGSVVHQELNLQIQKRVVLAADEEVMSTTSVKTSTHPSRSESKKL